jgi:ElaB/YqjD/DUF883 family membrane-anchored ribosome-binding protein
MRTETDKLVKDLKSCACDAEELIKATAGELNERTKEARLRLKTTLNSAKESCEALEERALEGVKVADRRIRAYPYESLGIALGIGLLIGLLMGRRS